MAARSLERGLLVPALGLGLAGTVLVAVARGAEFGGDPGTVSIGYIARIWAQVAAAAVACHLLLAARRRDCDELLYPLSLALCGLGLATIFSLAPDQAQKQMNWLWVSLAVLLATLHLPRLARLKQYTYTFGLLTAALLLLPMLFGREINGARLWLQFGGVTIQPGELAKITLVLFLAGYLERHGETLAAGGRKLLGITLPDPRYLGPLLVLWGVGMVLLVRLRDLGTALLFFGTAVAMLYAVTARASYLVAGALSFAGGAALCMQWFGHVRRRIEVWLDPWPQIDGDGYQIVQGLFALAAGGVSGVGLGLGYASRIPAASTDFPFAAIAEELGLWGAALVIALYLVWIYRAMRVGVSQADDYRALLAVGLGSLMALQTMVILGGVTKLIPLTGITLPFISYGGSSLVTNFLMLGLLLRCSEEGR